MVFGRSTAVVPGYYRLDSRLLFFVSGFTVLVAAVGAVVPLQAVVPRFWAVVPLSVASGSTAGIAVLPLSSGQRGGNGWFVPPTI